MRNNIATRSPLDDPTVAAPEQYCAPAPQPIYLDYHATTPTDPRVASVVLHHMTTAFGNASSRDHPYGREAEEAILTAAREVAELTGTSARRVVFTSGATESLNLTLQGFVRARRARSSPRVRIALPRLEHRAVLDTCEWLSERGDAELIWLPVDSSGRLDLDAVEDTCRRGIDLLCVMAANNEIGTLYPLAELGALGSRYGVPVLSDATQAVGKVPVRVDEWGLSMLALTAHKLYGPKGVGALIFDRDTSLEPILRGGGHQRGLRPGTLNVPGIAGLGEACRLRRVEMGVDEPAIARRRDRLQSILVEGIRGLVVNGDPHDRLAGNLHVSVPDVPNTAVIARVWDQVALATGSACSSGVESPSHVMHALQLPPPLIRGALRIGLGKFTTDEDVERAGEIISGAVAEIRVAMQRR
jgi:cysteine desulfurase